MVPRFGVEKRVTRLHAAVSRRCGRSDQAVLDRGHLWQSAAAIVGTSSTLQAKGPSRVQT
jgi:hypothetical protein